MTLKWSNFTRNQRMQRVSLELWPHKSNFLEYVLFSKFWFELIIKEQNLRFLAARQCYYFNILEGRNPGILQNVIGL